MKKLLCLVAALLLVPAVGTADDLSAELGGNKGFVSLQTDGDRLLYNIMVNDIGNPIGTVLKKGNSVFVDLDPNFDFGSASGTVNGLDLADLEANPTEYEVEVEGADGTADGKLVFAGDSSSGGDAPAADLEAVKMKAKYRNSGNLNLRCKVRNRGPEKSAATSVAFYLSDDQILSNDDTFLAESGLSAMDPNKVKSAALSVAAPSGASGQMYVICEADPFGINDDSDIDNNVQASGSVNLP